MAPTEDTECDYKDRCGNDNCDACGNNKKNKKDFYTPIPPTWQSSNLVLCSTGVMPQRSFYKNGGSISLNFPKDYADHNGYEVGTTVCFVNTTEGVMLKKVKKDAKLPL
jgi:hypothetical protein